MGGIDVVGTHSPATCSLLLCMSAILHLFHGHHCPEAESLLGIDVVGTHSPATCSLLLCMNAILHLFHGHHRPEAENACSVGWQPGHSFLHSSNQSGEGFMRAP